MIISWFSHSPWMHTGYGTQTKQVVARLKRSGHDVCVNPTLGGFQETIFRTRFGDEVLVNACGFLMCSNDMGPLNYHRQVEKHPGKTSVLVSLLDMECIQGNGWDGIPILAWVPIASSPLPHQVLHTLKQRPNILPIAMSRFGQRQMEEAGIEVFGHVPHAFERSVFYPRDHIDGVPTRELLQVPEDCFLIGMVAANPCNIVLNRKAFAECFMAFQEFSKDKKDVRLYVHTDMTGRSGGSDLTELCRKLGLDDGTVVFPDPVFFKYESGEDVIAAICSACDVGLVASYGEGFGIATIEFQAVGTPVIATDFGASPELVGPDSTLVEGQLIYDYVQQTFFKVPHIPTVARALQTHYERERKRVWEDTLHFARSTFDADVVYQRDWVPLLQRYQETHPV